MHSLNSRIMISAGVALAAFVLLSAFTLENAFRDSARAAREERLLAQIFLLMAAAEVDDAGQLLIAGRPTEPRLDLPESGLYAAIVDAAGNPVWESRSALSIELPATSSLSTGKQGFSVISHNGKDYFRKTYGIEWRTESGAFPFTFAVVEDTSAYQTQLGVYRRSLWLWLGAMAALLLVSQWAVLRWGLAPLRFVTDELNRLEAGESQTIDGRYPDEVQRLVDNLNKVLSQERKQQQRYRDALADLAHSLKTPLAVVRGIAGESGPGPRKTIEEQVAQMDRIVGYHLQRAAASGRGTGSAAIELRPVTERVAGALKKVYAEKTFDVAIEIEDGVCFRGDDGDLTEVLGNVVDNAFKWCRSKVCISALTDNSMIRLRVEDDGPGIRPTDAAHVFRRGARADESTPGHGIGLSLVHDIVSTYGGSTRVGASALGGAMIEMQLPGSQRAVPATKSN